MRLRDICSISILTILNIRKYKVFIQGAYRFQIMNVIMKIQSIRTTQSMDHTACSTDCAKIEDTDLDLIIIQTLIKIK